MKYNFLSDVHEFPAINIKAFSDTQTLNWDGAHGSNVIIIQSLFKVDVIDIMDDICKNLSNIKFELNKYIDISKDISIRFVTIGEKNKDNGCPLNGGASRYTILNYEIENDACNIYTPTENSMFSYFCDIPSKTEVKISKETQIKTKFFKKIEVPTEFYKLSFITDVYGGYEDGDIYYSIHDNVNIPITKEALERQQVFIKTSYPPKLYSKNEGLKIIVN